MADLYLAGATATVAAGGKSVSVAGFNLSGVKRDMTLYLGSADGRSGNGYRIADVAASSSTSGTITTSGAVPNAFNAVPFVIDSGTFNGSVSSLVLSQVASIINAFLELTGAVPAVAGDREITLNKSDYARLSQILFAIAGQEQFAIRQRNLAGKETLCLSYDPDGMGLLDAIQIDRATGQVTIANLIGGGGGGGGDTGALTIRVSALEGQTADLYSKLDAERTARIKAINDLAAQTSDQSGAIVDLRKVVDDLDKSLNLTDDESLLTLCDPFGFAQAVVTKDGALRTETTDFDSPNTYEWVLKDRFGFAALVVAEDGCTDTRNRHIDYLSARVDGFAVVDPFGFVGFEATASGAPVSRPPYMGCQFGADEIAAWDAEALAGANAVRMQTLANVAVLGAGINHIIGYGQSLMAAQEAWGGTLLAPGRSDLLMLGQSVRPASTYNSLYQPFGDSLLRPMAATVQNNGGDQMLTPAQVSALASGNDALGETPMESAALFLRTLVEGLRPVDACPLVASNAAVPGTTIEQLGRDRTGSPFGKLTGAATQVKAAGQAAGYLSYGVAALVHQQGQANVVTDFGGTTDKDTFKALTKTLFDNFYTDVVVGIAGQSRRPIVALIQTSGQWARDEFNHAIPMAQWELAKENPSIVLAAPEYAVTDKGGHLDLMGSRWEGLYLARALYETLALRRRWLPLGPVDVRLRGRTVLATFHVPAPPLQFQPFWDQQTAINLDAKGFSVLDGAGKVAISSVTIVGPATVAIQLGRDTSGTAYLYGGRRDDSKGGLNLCDSDGIEAPLAYTFTAGTGQYDAANNPALVGKTFPLRNYCINFRVPVVVA